MGCGRARNDGARHGIFTGTCHGTRGRYQKKVEAIATAAMPSNGTVVFENAFDSKFDAARSDAVATEASWSVTTLQSVVGA